MHKLEKAQSKTGEQMADNQKRDSKGRFKSKPSTGGGAPASSAPSVPDRPAQKTKKEKAKQRIVRLVKNPIYQPVAASRTMEDALKPVKDARSKKKRDKARKQMESTFGDIDWNEETASEKATERTPETPAEEGSNSAASLEERFEKPSLTSSNAPTSASLREELIAASGQHGSAWQLNHITQVFELLDNACHMKFIYAEDSYTDDIPQEMRGTDSVQLSYDNSKVSYFPIGQIAFLAHA